MKHLKHLKHMLATSFFHPSSGRRRAEWGTASSGQPSAEDGRTAWQPPATLAPSLGPTSDNPLSWPPSHTLQSKEAVDLGEVG